MWLTAEDQTLLVWLKKKWRKKAKVICLEEFLRQWGCHLRNVPTCPQTHRQAHLLSDVVFEVMSVLGDLAFLAQNNHSGDQMPLISNLRSTKKETVVRWLGMKRGAGYKLRDGPMVCPCSWNLSAEVCLCKQDWSRCSGSRDKRLGKPDGENKNIWRHSRFWRFGAVSRDVPALPVNPCFSLPFLEATSNSFSVFWITNPQEVTDRAGR